ncbi:hypothetical protein GCK72_023117 [Caenorhabditis remanei]|uniref:Uncharacterized protein n=1 Tax=Caenorhabditis remanei TaxID=31234 RepID=A0A6A5FVJ8_CAERE|nr:hypothetical protein GCK72_023117 [Caenorhabditis remanei]KAF1746660.1 hypothetical protein GCK72_023117 [Caenorhabditis remanei]
MDFIPRDQPKDADEKHHSATFSSVMDVPSLSPSKEMPMSPFQLSLTPLSMSIGELIETEKYLRNILVKYGEVDLINILKKYGIKAEKEDITFPPSLISISSRRSSSIELKNDNPKDWKTMYNQMVKLREVKEKSIGTQIDVEGAKKQFEKSSNIFQKGLRFAGVKKLNVSPPLSAQPVFIGSSVETVEYQVEREAEKNETKKRFWASVFGKIKK